MANISIGTAYFVSLAHAAQYYRDYAPGTDGYAVANEKIAAEEIHIGKPPLKDGERLFVIDNGTRYAIQSAYMPLHTFDLTKRNDAPFFSDNTPAMLALEHMIDSVGLSNVIAALASVCQDKALHIRDSWQDEPLARLWAKQAGLIDRCGAAVHKVRR